MHDPPTLEASQVLVEPVHSESRWVARLFGIDGQTRTLIPGWARGAPPGGELPPQTTTRHANELLWQEVPDLDYVGNLKDGGCPLGFPFTNPKKGLHPKKDSPTRHPSQIPHVRLKASQGQSAFQLGM